MAKTTKEQYKRQTDTMSVIHVHGHKHVIMPLARTEYPMSGIKWADPDYLGTGQALVGVLNKFKKQTLEEFKAIWIENKMILEKIAESQKLGKTKKV